MPKEGQEQLRTSKNVFDIRAEQRNIETEILKLMQEQNKALGNTSKAGRSLEAGLRRAYTRQSQILKEHILP